MKNEIRTFCGSGKSIEEAVENAESEVGDFLKDKSVREIRTALAAGSEYYWGFAITVVYGIGGDE